MQNELVVYAPTNNKIVIIPFNETQNLTKLKTTLAAYVDGSNIFIMHLALVGVNKPRERTCFILTKEMLPEIFILIRLCKRWPNT